MQYINFGSDYGPALHAITDYIPIVLFILGCACFIQPILKQDSESAWNEIGMILISIGTITLPGVPAIKNRADASEMTFICRLLGCIGCIGPLIYFGILLYKMTDKYKKRRWDKAELSGYTFIFNGEIISPQSLDRDKFIHDNDPYPIIYDDRSKRVLLCTEDGREYRLKKEDKA